MADLRSGTPQLLQLVYWARVNLAVADFLAGQPRSLIVSHERTVLEPDSVAEEIAAFLERPLTDATRATSSPGCAGRRTSNGSTNPLWTT